MIDFSKINSFFDGQRNSFEELVCQIARQEKLSLDSIYKRIEGSGGDGGIEAYWTKPNGKKIGYQAKFFLRSGDIDWSQIDKSVQQAIVTHPELEHYIIALPCDLTEKSGQKRKGKSGWEHWESRKTKWLEEAARVGIRDIQFSAWTKSELTTKLTNDNLKGLIEYFFGDVKLTHNWFNNKVQEAIVALDERYHPEDHVNVEMEKLSSIISRSPSFLEELLNIFKELKKTHIPTEKLISLKVQPQSKLFEEYQKSYTFLLALRSQISLDIQHSWNVKNWNEVTSRFQKVKNDLQQWLWQYSREPENSEKYTVDQLIRQNNERDEYLLKLLSIIDSKYIAAEKKKIAFINGRAGSGKSHLLAKCAHSAILKNQPSVLILGQHLNNNDLWVQIAHKLDMTNYSAEQILSSLDAAGKSAGIRTLLLIDAINEGTGSRFWRDHISSFLSKIERYSHICCIISCRSEYFKLAVPTNISEKYPIFTIQGFETTEEQLNAARVYLDRRGISRPSTPWLSPEFINPLFLRSICLSLEKDRKSELPSGLTGTKNVLKYYIESIGRQITEKEGSSTSLVSKLGKSVLDIAGKMLSNKTDYLELDTCRDLITNQFRHIQPQTEADWLSIFINNGLLRKDPSLLHEDLFSDEEIIRFSFQRFQDFLMAEFSLKDTKTTDTLFNKGEVLDFCIEDGELAWEWRGLLDGLAIALPEKFGVELIDTLPNGNSHWKNNWYLSDIFSESIKWRHYSAFSDRTLELLNIYEDELDVLDLLLQVATSVEHPWNADFLSKNLERRKLADRDSWWTTWLNDQDTSTDFNVGILIEWSRFGQVSNIHKENQYLAALTLCWFFTSSNRAIRDKSTKALTNIFLYRPSIFPKLLEKFTETDDLYILERLLAAAYGSCCLKPQHERLHSYSISVYLHIFKNGKPPLGILLRDYALGIIEISDYHSVLPENINSKICRPPYISPKLRLSVSTEKLKKIAEKADGDEILNSSTGSFGDFSKYEIDPRVNNFLRITLDKEVPLSDQQKFELFRENIVQLKPAYIEAFDALEEASNPYFNGILTIGFLDDENESKPTKEDIKEWKLKIEIAEHKFTKLLSKTEKEHYYLVCAPYLHRTTFKQKKEKTFDIPSTERWVTKRAYDLGWTKKLFPNDYYQHRHDYSRSRPNIERIGKKYQWIALDELSCRLADNYWLKEMYSNALPRPYKTPIDLGFERDIDPTIINESIEHPKTSPVINQWVSSPKICLDEVSENELVDWPFQKDPGENLKYFTIRTDDQGTKWRVIYEHQSLRQTYKDLLQERSGEHDSRMQEFRFLETIIINSSSAKNIALKMKKDKLSRGTGLGELQVTDEAFLHESPWRETWKQKKWFTDGDHLKSTEKYAPLIAECCWESHLDSSLPNGYSIKLPLPWLIKKLNLYIDQEQMGVWRDKNNEIIFQQYVSQDYGSICLLKEDAAKSLLCDETTFLSILIAERNAWPQGNNSNASWRRTEGACWIDKRGINSLSWNQDRRNGKKKSLNKY